MGQSFAEVRGGPDARGPARDSSSVECEKSCSYAAAEKGFGADELTFFKMLLCSSSYRRAT